MDVDFLVSDMLDVISPHFKRVDTVEAAEEFVAKLESEHKFSKARGLQALQVVCVVCVCVCVCVCVYICMHASICIYIYIYIYIYTHTYTYIYIKY